MFLFFIISVYISSVYIVSFYKFVFDIFGVHRWRLPPTTTLRAYLWHHYQNDSIQDIQIQCRKDQMQVSNVDKDMV